MAIITYAIIFLPQKKMQSKEGKATKEVQKMLQYARVMEMTHYR